MKEIRKIANVCAIGIWQQSADRDGQKTQASLTLDRLQIG